MKKFELTEEHVTITSGKKLYRVRALVAFGDVKAGELGGYVEKEENLSHEGNAWVFGYAWVYGSAQVYGNSQVYGNAHVSDNAHVYDSACVSDNVWVGGYGHVSGSA